MGWFLFLLQLVGALLVAALLAAYFIINRWEGRAKQLLQKNCVHVKGLPIIGMLPKFAKVRDTTDFHKLIDQIASTVDRQQMMASMWVLHRHWIVVSDPNIIEKVLASQNSLGRTSEYFVFRCVSQGVFTAEGARWKKLRKVLAKSLTPDLLNNYFDNYVVHLSKVACRVFGKTEGYYDVNGVVSRYFLDLILRSHFGLETNEIEENKYKVIEAQDKLLEIAFGSVMPKPYLHNDLMYNNSHFYKDAIRIRKNLYRPIEISAEMRYPEWKQNKEINGGAPVNSLMIDDFFQLTDEFKMEQNNESYTMLMADVIVAATDTTAFATNAFIYFLAANQHYQERVLDEIKQHWPDNTELTREILNELTFLEMCFSDAVRLTCPIAVLRPIAQDIFISDGCTIPKGSQVIVPIEHMHLSTHYYKNPTQFYPEHFLPEAVAARPKCAYIPFSYGLRACPGVNYGRQASKSLVAHIIKEFHIETNLRFEDVEYRLHFMKQFKQGYPIKFTRRSQK